LFLGQKAGIQMILSKEHSATQRVPQDECGIARNIAG
jgi:hypothetical protein